MKINYNLDCNRRLEDNVIDTLSILGAYYEENGYIPEKMSEKQRIFYAKIGLSYAEDLFKTEEDNKRNALKDIIVRRLERDLDESFTDIDLNCRMATEYLIIKSVIDMVLSDKVLANELIIQMAEPKYRMTLTQEIFRSFPFVDDMRVFITDLDLLADYLYQHFINGRYLYTL